MAFADTGGMLSYACESLNAVDLFANSSPDYVGDLETARQDAAGEFGAAIDGEYEDDRTQLQGLLSAEKIRAKIDILLEQFTADVGSKAKTNAQRRADLHDYMVANSDSVKERALTFGTRSFSGTGNGTLYRLEVDEDAIEMQGWFSDSYTLECELSQRQLRFSGEEVFSLYGTGTGFDDLNPGGQDEIGRLVALNPASTQNLVRNGMFASATLSGANVTGLGTWTIGTGNLQADTTNTYWSNVRGVPAASLRALKFTDNDSISQDIVVDAGAQVQKDVPYFCALVLYKDGCDGTTTFVVGNQSKAQAMSGLTDTAFSIITIPIDEDCWFKSLEKNTFTVSVTLSSRTTGTMSVAGVIVAPMTRVGAQGDGWTGRGCMGHYFALLAGSTPFVVGDNWTWTDSEGTRGKNQYWWARAGYGYLPHDATPSIADAA